jgi:hypothetical protein
MHKHSEEYVWIQLTPPIPQKKFSYQTEHAGTCKLQKGGRVYDEVSIGGSFTNWIYLLKFLHWIFLKLRYFQISIKILNDSQGHQMMLCLKLLKWRLLAKIMNHSMLSSVSTEY